MNSDNPSRSPRADSFLTFTNSVVRYDRPDPGVNRIGAWFYMVATGKGRDGGAFPLLRSENLVAWEEIGTVFPSGEPPVWSANTDFWAPEIHEVANGKIHVYFTARDYQGALHLGVAVADTPIGPYTDPLGAPLISDPFWAIDASYFSDPESQKQYLLWKIDGNAHRVPSVLKMCELDASGIKIAEGSVEHELLRSSEPWEAGVVEGPWLMKRGTFYYLFYSGGCFANANYCVGVARATALVGPYTKCGAPILCSGRGWAGPGHCVVIPTEAGDVMVYHAHQSSKINHVDSVVDSPRWPLGRHVLVDRVYWHADGWPRVGRISTPTPGPQPALNVMVPYPGDALRSGGHYSFQPIGTDLFLQHDGSFTSDSDDIKFIVCEGLCSGGTISLRPFKSSEKLLRHRFGKIQADVSDGSVLFNKDATWQVVPGLQINCEDQNREGSLAISLRSINYPENYITCGDPGSNAVCHHVDVNNLSRVTYVARCLNIRNDLA
eukprot:TRINITY_DN4693_c0_g1_i1.p1 TRINITY_DN4693_c0_g1~~TRINITY_DN4693_c0_g1_i1.p1  ORF type:complete len:558 (-),score=43.34 TRINITY_DN4693_c0_g1_i1:60-1538(-)